MRSAYIEKQNQNQIRQQTALKNFRFNRFLLLRYSLAGFFFVNLYWSLALFGNGSALSMVPIALMMICVLSFAEYVKLYGEKSDQMNNKLRFSLFFHYSQIAVNIILSLIVATGIGYATVFTFLTDSIEAKLFLASLLTLGLILSFVCIKRIHSIQNQKDKHYQYIKEFRKMNESGEGNGRI